MTKFVTEYFSLNSEALDKLSELVPEFGYDGFGEIVFYRTYSRLKANGQQENWHDVVVRVINGTMTIRKDWYVKNGVEWDEDYWQRYAYRMAVSMFNMNWLPAGRGMWAMGTQFIYERGAMALNNCFAGETKFVSLGKLVTLKDTVGQTVYVNTTSGQKKATVKSFGQQKLIKFFFKPLKGHSSYRFTQTATANHRWLLSDGSETTHLTVGNSVWVKPGNVQKHSQAYNDGLTHGMIFADGTQQSNDTYRLRLCGIKDEQREFLEGSRWYSHTIDTADQLLFITNQKLKEVPNNESLEYKQGFVDGWRMFDGFGGRREDYRLDTINTDAVQWLSEHSGILNYVMTGHTEDNSSTNYGERTSPLHRCILQFRPVEFRVEAKHNTDRFEEVYCVVEPDTHTFQLAYGIITGNCGATKLGSNDRLANDFHWMMDALMLGVGVGFEAFRDDLKIYKPVGTFVHYIGDSREGWCDSLRMLIEAYTMPGKRKPIFKDDHVRKKGALIRGFGGKSSGPGPLMDLFRDIEVLFETPGIDIVRLKTDIANKIGVCVVAGNVRRSAELAKGKITDPVFMDLKDYSKYPEREDFGYMSNNSVALYTDEDFEMLGEVARRVVTRGEPGIINLRNLPFGRIGKREQPREDLADIFNPCGEIPLEDKELCNVVETTPTRCKSVQAWYEACEYAAFYACTVSLLPTHRAETNRVVVRNRRIGVGIIDWTGWIHEAGLHKVTSYMRKGYAIVVDTATRRNAEAGVPAPIRFTTIKPGGTGPKLPGKTSGIGYPTFRETLRRMRVAANAPIVPVLDGADIPFQPCYFDPEGTRIYEYPTLQGPAAPADEISLWEQATNLVTVQREWSDNAVSNTLYFRPKWKLVKVRDCDEDQFSNNFLKEIEDEWGDLQWSLFIKLPKAMDVTHNETKRIVTKKNKYGTWELYLYEFDPQHEEDIIEKVLASIAPLIKSCSVLPHSAKGAYRQMPEEGISREEYELRLAAIGKLDWNKFCGSDGQDEKYCSGDTCERVA